MHEPQDHPPGPNSRRGKPLAPIQTTFTPDPVDPIQAVQRPPPVETIIYKTSPKRTLAVPEQSTGNRRASRNFLGLFGRSKSLKDSQAQESASAIEQDESRSRKTSYSSGMSSSKSIESKPRKSSSTRKEKSQKLMMTWDPLPLIQAHSQAVRHATLSAPATSAESLLRAAKKKTDVSVFDSLSTGSALPFEDEQPEHGNKLKKGGPPAHALSWTTKTFVLTVSGFLLQYAGSGTNERLPEKILQLTADSAAYASDVIPGRHWVLRVTSSKEEDNQPAPPPPKSMFSKFSHRNEPKRSTTDVLLVMENADDMSSWLVSVRKVIQALGGQSYRPDESSHKDPSEAIQRLQQKPSRRFLIQRNPDKDPDPSEISPKAFSPEEDTPLASNGTDPFTLDRHTLTHVNTSASVTSEATMRPNARDTTKSKLFKRKSKEGVKSTRPTFPPPPPPLPLPANNEASASLLKWELPENFAASFSGTALNISTTIAEHDPRRESVSSVPSLSSQGRSHRSLSEQSDSQAPNFSLPTFSNRFSHSTKSGTIGTPPTSSGSAFRNDSPVSPLEETPSKRKISISYETPAIVEQPVREHMAEASDTVIPLPEDPSDWEDADDLPPLMAPRFKSPPPKRLSSLQHRDEQLPLSDPDLIPAIAPASVPKDVPSPRRHPSLEFASSQPPRKNRVSYISHLPPQQPPPTGALPAIPSSPTDSSATRPSFDSIPSRKSRQSAEIRPTTSPKLRRPASMQVRPRAISQSVEKPDGVPATLQPAVSQPLTPPAKIRERRSFVVQPPSHILGPPPAPPPSNPLPSIPQPKSAPPKVDTLNVESVRG